MPMDKDIEIGSTWDIIARCYGADELNAKALKVSVSWLLEATDAPSISQ